MYKFSKLITEFLRFKTLLFVFLSSLELAHLKKKLTFTQ